MLPACHAVEPPPPCMRANDETFLPLYTAPMCSLRSVSGSCPPCSSGTRGQGPSGLYFTERWTTSRLVVVRDRRRIARPHQRVPAPRRRGGVRRGPLLDPAVPLPRLDLRSRRRSARGPALGGQPRVRPRRAGAALGPGRNVGTVHLRQRRLGCRAAARHPARAAGSWRAPVRLDELRFHSRASLSSGQLEDRGGDS